MKRLQEDLLSQNEVGSFVVRKELTAHPAVPEFTYNGAECRQFIEEIGQIHKVLDMPENDKPAAVKQPGTDVQTYLDKMDSQILQLRSSASRAPQHQLLSMYQQQMPAQDAVFWPKWDTYETYQFDFFRRKWTLVNDIRPTDRFLYFSSVCHMPKQLGMFILGGSDVDDNFSKRVIMFNRYKQYEDKAPMI